MAAGVVPHSGILLPSSDPSFSVYHPPSVNAMPTLIFLVWYAPAGFAGWCDEARGRRVKTICSWHVPGRRAVSHRGNVEVGMVLLHQVSPGIEKAEGAFVRLTLLGEVSTVGFFVRACSDELSARLVHVRIPI